MTLKTCSLEGCDVKHSSKGYCAKHYARILRNGTPHRDEYYVGENDRECTKCRETKSNDNFAKSKRNLNGRARECNACRNARQAERLLDPEYREEAKRVRELNRVSRVYGPGAVPLLESINAGTASCHSCGTREGRLCIDHNHNTGKIRGILCHGCNVTLGFMSDDPDRLTYLLAYLFRTEDDLQISDDSEDLSIEDIRLITAIVGAYDDR